VEYFTLRNTAILGLTQVGVIVAGVLAAGAAQKWRTEFNIMLPRSTVLAAEQGHFVLVVPLVWTAVALWTLRPGDHDEARVVAFCAGVLVLILLLAGVWHAGGRPFFNLLCGCGGLSS
jgi:hypothetical protein